MSLVHPRDLGAWLAWQSDQHRLRHLKGQVVGTLRPHQPRWSIAASHDAPRVVVAMDSANPSAVGSLIAPLRHLRDLSVAVVAPFPLDHVVTALDLPVRQFDPGRVDGLVDSARCVVTAGHYLPVGVATERAAHRYGRPLLMVQHGALTPLAPPLPRDCTVLAWSDDDGEFWRSRRDDVGVVSVGSQLLWDASQARAPGISADAPLTYLGQGHAAELPRTRLVEAALRFCRDTQAVYRPHPSERDKLSRLTHAGYRRAGVEVDGSVPLNQLPGSVVSVFSTGVLEAAAQGRDAWVDFPGAPPWLAEFWERYSMSRFGQEPTAAPARPAVQPAEAIARIIEKVAA